MSGVKSEKDIIDEILNPGDSLPGWCLAVVAVVVIGLAVIFAR